MKVSLNWLKKYVTLPSDLTPVALASRLTLSTVEVEGVENLAATLDKIVVAKIFKVEPHPGADKLRLVTVDIKKEKLTVVCGGINLREAMLVALAQVGARVRWHGEGDLITLEKAKIRGVESAGMICAADEIGLGELFPAAAEGEIVDLSHLNLNVGEPLAKELSLDDVIIEIDNKSITNRPDLWGHYGLARELAVIYKAKLAPYQPKKILDNKEVNLAVEIKEPELCARYLGVMIDGVEVKESPEWLKRNLTAIGLKPINNIVDITNYLLFDLGQPMHAFDSELIYNKKIIVRRAKKQEKITTLDGVKRVLSTDDLVIADETKAVALAGVMGGENSEITQTTKSVILESATFEPFNIRRTAARYNLRTEAAIRFEKSLDPQMAKLALERAMELIIEMCPQARVVSAVADEYPRPAKELLIETAYDFLNQRIGQTMAKDDVNDILERLGFVIKKKNGELKVVVPSWRATKDISIPEDLVEEISRLYGYDNLTPVMPQVALSMLEGNKLRELERECKNILVNVSSATEVYNYSFTSAAEIEKSGLVLSDHVEVENPLSEDQKYLRSSLLPSLLKNVAQNHREQSLIKMFEVSRVFINKKGLEIIGPGKEDCLPDQPVYLSGVVYDKGNAAPFFAAKGVVETLFEKLSLRYLESPVKDSPSYAHPRRIWQAEIDGEKAVTVGEFHPTILNAFGLTEPVAFWQINLSKLNELYTRKYVYQPLPKYPAVELDLAMVVEEKVLWKDIKNLVKSLAPQIIKEIKLFDVYKNDKIGTDKKSVAFHISYQATDRTLELKEVQKVQDKIVEQLKKALKAKVRS